MTQGPATSLSLSVPEALRVPGVVTVGLNTSGGEDPGAAGGEEERLLRAGGGRSALEAMLRLEAASQSKVLNSKALG